MKRHVLFCLIVFTLLISSQCKADSYYWTGNGGNANWNNSGNWFDGSTLGFTTGFPGNSDDAYIGENFIFIFSFNEFTGPNQPSVNTASSCANLYMSSNVSAILTMSAALTVSGAISIDGTTTVTGSSLLKGASLALTSSTTLTQNAPVTISGLAAVNGGVTPTIKIGGGNILKIGNGINVGPYSSSLYFTSTTSGIANISGAIKLGGTATFSVGSGITMNLTSGSLVTGGNYTATFANNGTINTTSFPITLDKSVAVTNTGTITANSNITFDGNPTSLNNNGGTINVQNASTFTMGPNSQSLTNSGIINVLAASAFSITSSGFTLNNTGTITVTPSATAISTFNCPITSSTCNINNTYPGTINLTGLSTIASPVFTFSPNSSIITNTGSINTSFANITITSNIASLQNSGTNGSIVLNGSAITLASGCFIKNTAPAVFTAQASSSIVLGALCYISNSGTFNAGTSNSQCVITTPTSEGGNMTGLISNTGTFNLGSTSIIYLNNTQSSSTATIVNTSPGIFTLKSDAFGSAAIGAISSSGFNGCTGTFNVQRFLNGGGTLANRGYRLLSSPVNQTADAAGTLTTPNTFGLFYLGLHSYGGTNNYPGALTVGIGGSTKGFAVSNNNPTIYFYDETQVYNGRSFTLGNHAPVYAINSKSTGTGINLITTSTEDIGSLTGVNVPVGNGFLMYFVGPSSRTDALATTPPADVTMTANGHLNQGTIPVKLWTGGTTLSYTTGTAATHPYPGLNMVGNPYPCTIDLSKVLSDNAASINGIYVLSARNSPNQTYIAFTPNGSSSPSAGYAVSGEGFFVTAKGPANTNTLTFNELEKVPATQLAGSALIMSAPNTQAKTLSGKLSSDRNSLAAAEPQGNALTGLYMKIEQDSVTYNYCGIYFRKDWSATFAEDDAKDLNGNTGPVVISSLSSDNIRASVNHMPDYTKGVNVKLYTNARADGQYKLKIEGIRNIDTLYDIYLIDNYKKDSLDIRRYGTYLFDISKADTSSYGGTRFELSVRPRPLPAYRLLNFVAQKVTGGVQVSWKTEAESNYTGFVLQKQDGPTFSPLYSKQGDGSGIYTYIDPSPVSGANTYRLQQDNIVGAISLSPAITIIYNPAGSTGLMSVYPNPTKASISVSVTTITSAPQTYKANIYNSAGRMMMQRSVSSNSWTEDVTQYTPGTYIIQLNDNSGNLVGKSKFVKTN